MAHAVIAYDKELRKMPGRLPWLKPDAHLVKDANAETGWLEYFVEGLTIQLSAVRACGEQAIRRDLIANNATHPNAKFWCCPMFRAG